MSIPVLQPKLLLGLRTSAKGNAQFITDEEVIYPVGGVLSVHNFNIRRQKFIKLPERGHNVTSFSLSPNKMFVAVAEKGEKPSITLYDPFTYKRKRQIILNFSDREVNATELVAVTFTYDSKYLMVVTGEPDYHMFVFKVEKGKLDSDCRGNNSNQTGTVTQIAGNPNDANALVIVGNGVFKILACSEGNWRQYGFNKADQLNLTCVTWLTQDRVLTGSMDGKLMLIESGDLKAVFSASDLPVLNLKFKEEEQVKQSSQTNISISSNVSVVDTVTDYEIRALFSFGKGFMFSYKNGRIHLYEKESGNLYRKRNVFKIPNHGVDHDDLTEEEEEKDEDFVMNVVNCLCVSPTEDKLIATCAENQIYTTRLWGPDMTICPEITLTELGYSLHHGPIGGLAVCHWKPIFMTSGIYDRSLRVWNYETETMEVCKTYLEDIHAISLHPTGLFAIVGFSDKLRFMTILIDDYHITREFPVRNCKMCEFSRMGHLFAAVNGNIIQVYSSVSFEHMFNLKGHNGKVRGISWCHDDHKMSSCGSEGTVYEWQISTTRRISETIIKTCSFTDTAITSDGKSTYAVGSDGRIRELKSSVVHRDVAINHSGLDAIALSNSDMMMFATGNNGLVYSIKVPILDNAEFLEYTVHSATVTQINITYDDKHLITCSDFGTVCIWKILNLEGKAIKLEKEFKPSTETLISREDLESKVAQIKDLTVRMHELQTEHAYQMRQNDTLHNTLLKEVHEGYCSAIEELKEKNEQMEAEHVQEVNNINLEISKTKAAHEDFVQNLEASYNEKLINEYDKYLRLEEKLERTRNMYELRLFNLENAKAESEKSITNKFLEQLRDKNVQLEELIEQSKLQTKEHELIKQQIEDDADREIFELKTAHETQLKEEQESNFRLKGEAATARKKLQAAVKEIDELKTKVTTLVTEHSKFKGIIVGLEKDIVDLKKEIAERDSTIQDKEKRIFELKHNNQELEKFKFILEFKIKELKSQIEPRDRQIREQMEQISEMVNELENLQKIIMTLELQLAELREKLQAAHSEVKREILKYRAAKATLKTIRTDIHEASGFIQNIPRLVRAVREMYHKYNADKDFALTQAEDFESKNEFLRQRDFLERTVKSLQKQVYGRTSTGGGDKARLVEENSTLIVETNVLRKDLKQEQRKSRKMESLLGISKKTILPKEGMRLLQDAVATRDDIHTEYKEQIKEEQQKVVVIQEENNRLISKVTEAVDTTTSTHHASENQP